MRSIKCCDDLEVGDPVIVRDYNVQDKNQKYFYKEWQGIIQKIKKLKNGKKIAYIKVTQLDDIYFGDVFERPIQQLKYKPLEEDNGFEYFTKS
ncbi:MAG: hypothetical protein H7A23_23090 [Leptospiraceae bacterium]|nr:hypothetical protein [Leptospiraceae bacterium]MCP5497452.1 hypothetical protein [Leptospiraceae bacterium]